MVDVLHCADCRGRTVRLEEWTWRDKMLLDHAELDGIEAAIEQILVDPEVRSHDRPHIHRENFYRRGVLPSPYHEDLLKVVVEFRRENDDEVHGRVVTAYATVRVARGEKRIGTRPQFRELPSSLRGSPTRPIRPQPPSFTTGTVTPLWSTCSGAGSRRRACRSLMRS